MHILFHSFSCWASSTLVRKKRRDEDAGPQSSKISKGSPHDLLGLPTRWGGCEIAAVSNFSNRSNGRGITVEKSHTSDIWFDREAFYTVPWKFSTTRDGVTLFGKTTVWTIKKIQHDSFSRAMQVNVHLFGRAMKWGAELEWCSIPPIFLWSDNVNSIYKKTRINCAEHWVLTTGIFRDSWTCLLPPSGE